MDAVANFGISAVAVAPTPTDSGLTLQVSTGEGALFPAPPFNAVVWPTGVRPRKTNATIVRVTGIVADAFTFTRLAEPGVLNRAIIVGDQISAPGTAKMLTDLFTAIDTNTANIAAQVAALVALTTRVSGIDTVQGADPAAPFEGQVWFHRTGVSPALEISLRMYVDGVTRIFPIGTL